jgi:AraC-like ligand binding domain
VGGGSKPPYQVIALSDVATAPTPASLSWRPIRAAMGIGAFGVGGYVAAEAGQDVIEPHTESPGGRGHQELYLVVRGAARFALDGEPFDAPAGTLVFVRDPSVHRRGVATKPDTEVLAFGGDAMFQPAGDEWMWRVRALLPADIETARALVDDGLEEHPDNPGVWYSNALVAMVEDRPGEARKWLDRAIERMPALRDEALREAPLASCSGATCQPLPVSWLMKTPVPESPPRRGASVWSALIAWTAAAKAGSDACAARSPLIAAGSGHDLPPSSISGA